MSKGMVSEAGLAAATMAVGGMMGDPLPSNSDGRSSEGASRRPSAEGGRLLGRPKSPEQRPTSPGGRVLGMSAQDIESLSGFPNSESKGKLPTKRLSVSDDRPSNLLKPDSRPGGPGVKKPSAGSPGGGGSPFGSEAQSKTKKDELSNPKPNNKKLPAPGDDRIVQETDGVSADGAKDGASCASEDTEDDQQTATLAGFVKAGMAKAKTVVYVAKQLGEFREQRNQQKLLEYYMEGLTSDDWMKRKISIDESMDMILANVAQAKAAQQVSVVDEQYELVQSSILPLISDLNWRVRKSIVRSLHMLAKFEGRKVKGMLLPFINTAPTYAGRWCSANIMMSIPAPSEESFRKRVTEAMFIALSDEHWIVRQEALEALPQLVQVKDDAVIQRGLELLGNELPSLRRTGIEVLRKFVGESARHDPMTDVQLAKRLLRTGLIGKNAFDSCDVNGNGLLSVRELRAALRDKYEINLSLKRMVVFAKDMHDKDMTFFNFMDLVKSHMSSADAIEKENAKEKVNKKRLAQQLLDGMVQTLPVDYSPITMTLQLLKMSLEVESDWMTRDKLHSMCLSMAPMFDKDVPVLIHRGLSTFNAKLCLTSCRTLLSLTTDLEDPAYRSSLLKGSTHIFTPATEEAGATMVEESWDMLHALSERLSLPNIEVKIAVIQCLQRFWDRGQTTTEARRKQDALLIRTKRYQQDVIKELNKVVEQAAREERAPVAGRRGSVTGIERTSSAGRRTSLSSCSGSSSKKGAEPKPVLWTVESFMELDHDFFQHESPLVMDRFKDWHTATADLKQAQERCDWLMAIDRKIAEQLQLNTEHEDPTLSDDAAMLFNDWKHAEEKRKSSANWKGAGIVTGMAAMVGTGRLGSSASGKNASPSEDGDGPDRTSSAFSRRRSSVSSVVR